MKIDDTKFEGWLKSKEHFLPGLSGIVTETDSKLLIVGASVFELYALQGWMPQIKRQTGDFDLSVGIVGDDLFYNKAKKNLIDLDYKIDTEHPYRFHPAVKIPGGLQYIDLLAYPLDEATNPDIARNAMGVGKNFSVEGFKFASENSYTLEKNIIFPNPLGMIILKMEGYLDEPVKRIKDFADILELVSGIVQKGHHFELEDEWLKAKAYAESLKLIENLKKITSEDMTWDIENVRYELNRRLISDAIIDNTLIQEVKDFVIQLTD